MNWARVSGGREAGEGTPVEGPVAGAAGLPPPQPMTATASDNAAAVAMLLAADLPLIDGTYIIN